MKKIIFVVVLFISFLSLFAFVESVKNVNAFVFDTKEPVLTYFFSKIERRYIAAGKTKEILEEVLKMSYVLTGEFNKEISIQDLLDGEVSNYEFYGIQIEKLSKGIDKKITLFFLDATVSSVDIVLKNIDLKVVYIGNGELTPSDLFIRSEVEQMRKNISKGKALVKKYQNIKNIKDKVEYILDASSGKIEGVTISCTPSYYNQMGFKTEEDMRMILSFTNNIEIQYCPHDSFGLDVSSDFKVLYYTDFGKIETYVAEMPLKMLKK